MIGQAISHYKITEKLGEGGMGEVYRADTRLKRKVALRFLPTSLQADSNAHRRFVRAAKSGAAKEFSSIRGVKEGEGLIVMECVWGQT